MIMRNGWTYMMNDMARTYIMMQEVDDFPVRPVNRQKGSFHKRKSRV